VLKATDGPAEIGVDECPPARLGLADLGQQAVGLGSASEFFLAFDGEAGCEVRMHAISVTLAADAEQWQYCRHAKGVCQ
jgi:hypothetical protein